jgi:thiol-disulfide isomerase/thioredoxin
MVKTRYSKKSYKKYKGGNKTRKNNVTPVIVGVIHANWCGHCQALMPKWKIFKNQIKNNNKINVLEIEDSDHDKDKRIANLNLKINNKSVRLQASGFPTIFKIQNGNLEYYNGEREPESLKQWALGNHKKILPTPMPVKKPSGIFNFFN